MTKSRTNKLLTLAALAVITSMAGTTNSYAAGLGANGGPSVPGTTVQPSVSTTAGTTTDTNALHEWHDEVIKNDKMRQRMDLSGVKAEPTDEKSGLKQWQDKTVKNNAMRSRMGLSQQ